MDIEYLEYKYDLHNEKSSIAKRYKRLQYAAKQRKLDLTISYQFFRQLIQMKCFYCTQPSTGLDRLDNTIGYVPYNVVPCCRPCNTMKMDQLLEDFINKCHTISKRFKKFNLKKLEKLPKFT